VEKPKTEIGVLEFDNLNSVGDALDYIQATSPEKLLEEIKKIRLPVKIMTIYSYGNVHIAWILTRAKLKKVKGK
jgi:hypothetical protein